MGVSNYEALVAQISFLFPSIFLISMSYPFRTIIRDVYSGLR